VCLGANERFKIRELKMSLCERWKCSGFRRVVKMLLMNAIISKVEIQLQISVMQTRLHTEKSKTRWLKRSWRMRKRIALLKTAKKTVAGGLTMNVQVNSSRNKWGISGLR